MFEPAEPERAPRPPSANSLYVMSLFAKADLHAAAAGGAACGALVLFAVTAALLLQGAPPGYPIGPNLSALGTFLPGYSVTWPGALVGAAYGALTGAVVAFAIAALWNFSHLVIIGVTILSGDWLEAGNS